MKGEWLGEYIDERVWEHFHLFHLYLMHLSIPCVPLFFYLAYVFNGLWAHFLEVWRCFLVGRDLVLLLRELLNFHLA